MCFQKATLKREEESPAQESLTIGKKRLKSLNIKIFKKHPLTQINKFNIFEATIIYYQNIFKYRKDASNIRLVSMKFILSFNCWSDRENTIFGVICFKLHLQKNHQKNNVDTQHHCHMLCLYSQISLERKENELYNFIF